MPHITIPDSGTIQEATRVNYDYTGPGTGPFTIPFPYFADGDLSVYLDGVLQTLTTHYTITGTAVDGGFSGGSLSFVGSISNAEVVIVRDVPVERLSDFSASGPFPMDTLNLTLDKNFAILQQVRTTVDRTLRLADSDPTLDATLPDVATRAGQFLYFDPVTGAPTVAASLGTGTATITPFMVTVLDDANQATAQATLGVPSTSDLKGRLLDVQIFTSNGTWTKPSETKAIEVICIAGGGGGGASTTSDADDHIYAGSGGGGGGAGVWAYFDSGIGATEPVVVGAGGAGGAISGAAGAAGGNTQFGNVGGGGTIEVVADGAAGGLSATAATANHRDFGDGGGPGQEQLSSVTGGTKFYITGGAWGGTGACHAYYDGVRAITGFASRAKGGDSAFGFGIGFVDSAVEFSTSKLLSGVDGDGWGTSYGCGGSGSARYYMSTTATISTTAGGDGSDGIVIVKSYG